MRNQILTSISIAALIVTGLAPAASAQVDRFTTGDEPVEIEIQPIPELVLVVPVTVTIPDPDPKPDPQVNPGVKLDDPVLVNPTIPEEPPFPPDDEDEPQTFNPKFELCLNLEKFCPPKIDDLLNPTDPVDPVDPGDKTPVDPDDDPVDPEDEDEEPTDPEDGDDDSDDDDSDDGDDDGSDDDSDDDDSDDDSTDDDGTDDDGGDEPDGNSGIDQPVPGNPSFTG